MKKIILNLTVISLFLLTPVSFLSGYSNVKAQSSVKQARQQLTEAAKISGINVNSTLDGQIAQIIKLALGFLGVVFLVLIIMAGFKWMTAGGASDQVKQAQASLINASIGLTIVLFSYLITNYVIFSLFEIIAK